MPSVNNSRCITQEFVRSVEGYLASYSTLKEIDAMFHQVGVQADGSCKPVGLGQRRTLFRQYFYNLDLDDSNDCQKLADFCGLLLKKARYVSNAKFHELREALHDNGYRYYDGKAMLGNNRITEITRRKIFEGMPFSLYGRLGEIEFLERIYELEALPTTDPRTSAYPSAKKDIFQHRVDNDDWDYDWLLFYEPIGLMDAADEEFLALLCESVHPVVRSDLDEVQKILAFYNKLLLEDGWGIIEVARMSGHPIFGFSCEKEALARYKHIDNTIYAQMREEGLEVHLEPSAGQDRSKRNQEFLEEFRRLECESDTCKRGKQLENWLNAVFEGEGIQIEEAFTLVGPNSIGIVSQIDGAIRILGNLYLVEMKWWANAIGPADIAPLMVKVKKRSQTRGIFVSASGYTKPACQDTKEWLGQSVVLLCDLHELVDVLKANTSLSAYLQTKTDRAQTHMDPYYKPNLSE